MKPQTKIRDNHTMSLENKPTTYSSMIYLRFIRLKFSFFEVSQIISERSDFAKLRRQIMSVVYTYLKNSSRAI